MENGARRWAGAAAMAVTVLTTVATTASAEPARRIVLHVCFGDAPTARQLDAFEKAQQHAADIYESIGITLVWTTDRMSADTDAGVIHLSVHVLSDARTNRLMKGSPKRPQTVLGVAPSATRRVYVFWDRILRHAQKQDAQTAMVLGRVIAHEIGHHLLPTAGHSRNGLMQASLNYRLSKPPAFTSPKVESIRALLVAAN